MQKEYGELNESHNFFTGWSSSFVVFINFSSGSFGAFCSVFIAESYFSCFIEKVSLKILNYFSFFLS